MDDLQIEIESSICAYLRGEEDALERCSTPEIANRVRDVAAYHGLGPLLSARFKRSSATESVDGTTIFPRRQLMDAAAVELVRTRELNRVLDSLAQAGVEPLVLKGAALAHCVYPSPVMRPRADTDLLIPHDRREIVDQALLRLGYEKQNAVTGRLVSYQCSYGYRDRFDIEHVLDVHWRISNTQAFSRVLLYDTLMERSSPIPALGEHARTLATADALLLACMHRVHHLHRPYRVDGLSTQSGDRLIWVYDIHLLLGTMSDDELLEFGHLSKRTRMRAVCRDGIMQAIRCFGSRVPEDLLRLLHSSSGNHESERYLRTGRFQSLANELRSLSRSRDRIALLAEHLFPPPAYMLAKYSVSNRAWLPILYVQRGIRGAWRRMLDS